MVRHKRLPNINILSFLLQNKDADKETAFNLRAMQQSFLLIMIFALNQQENETALTSNVQTPATNCKGVLLLLQICTPRSYHV